VCWGSNDYGQLSVLGQPGGATGFTEVSAGISATCALRTDTSASCWGNDAVAQTSPISGAGTGVAHVVAGYGSTCLYFTDGTFRCYGTGALIANSDPWARPEE
jgi:hypothetical protein